jgi:hypothetical protein
MFTKWVNCSAVILIVTLCASGCFADTKGCKSAATVEQADVPDEILDEARSFNAADVYPRLDSMGISLTQEKVDETYVTKISNEEHVYTISKYPYGVLNISNNKLTIIYGRMAASMNVSYLDYLLKPHFTVVSELNVDSMSTEREVVACGAYGFGMFSGENVYLSDGSRWVTLPVMSDR